MSTSLYRYPRDIIAPLRAQWHEWARYEGDAPKLPSDEHLQLLLEVAYHASFTVDEQRRTQFRLVVCSEEQARCPLRIDPSRDFVPHEIMRLAPVASDTGSMLGLAIVDEKPTIWGICASAFMCLVISVKGPGVLHVGRNERIMVALEGGQFSDAYSHPGVLQAVIECLAEANRALWKGVNWPGGAWSPQTIVFPGLVYDALARIRDAGHGGAVLVVPEADWQSRSWDSVLQIKYRCNDDAIWPCLATTVRQYDQAVMRDPQQSSASAEAEATARGLLARLAGLAAVDGAVLVTDRLRILGFGVEVLAPAGSSSIELSDGNSREVTAYGTRHRSAFRFCEAYPRGTAFVCSQDGGIKCVRARGGRVRVWQ